ncbi:MAG: T9SS type A sorting domain-containing protein, partial [Chitinophagaceae bacterium]|nr:T9SS type A sorting domain-containing protein [Chitinophagaceae bacterium]
MFTNGQKERIRQLFAASGARESLLYSDGLRIQQPDDPSSATTGEGTRRLSVVPNPAAVAITLQIENQLLSSGYSYTIYDVNGRTITSGRYSGNAISVKALQQGIYFIHLRRDEQTMVTKFLKQ